MINVKEELLGATGEPPQDEDEHDSEFKLRLLEAASEMDMDDYENLSIQACNWIQAGIHVVEEFSGEFVEDIKFPAFPEDTIAEREADDEMVDNPKTGKRMQQRKKPSTSRRNNIHSQSWNMKILIAKNPDISWAALQARMNELGFEPSESVCQIALSHFRESLRVLRHLEMLK